MDPQRRNNPSTHAHLPTGLSVRSPKTSPKLNKNKENPVQQAYGELRQPQILPQPSLPTKEPSTLQELGAAFQEAKARIADTAHISARPYSKMPTRSRRLAPARYGKFQPSITLGRPNLDIPTSATIARLSQRAKALKLTNIEEASFPSFERMRERVGHLENLASRQSTPPPTQTAPKPATKAYPRSILDFLKNTTNSTTNTSASASVPAPPNPSKTPTPSSGLVSLGEASSSKVVPSKRRHEEDLAAALKRQKQPVVEQPVTIASQGCSSTPIPVHQGWNPFNNSSLPLPDTNRQEDFLDNFWGTICKDNSRDLRTPSIDDELEFASPSTFVDQSLAAMASRTLPSGNAKPQQLQENSSTSEKSRGVMQTVEPATTPTRVLQLASRLSQIPPSDDSSDIMLLYLAAKYAQQARRREAPRIGDSGIQQTFNPTMATATAPPQISPTTALVTAPNPARIAPAAAPRRSANTGKQLGRPPKIRTAPQLDIFLALPGGKYKRIEEMNDPDTLRGHYQHLLTGREKKYTSITDTDNEQTYIDKDKCIANILSSKGNNFCLTNAGVDFACRTCTSSMRVCARLIRHGQATVIAIYPRPPSRRTTDDWKEIRFYI